MKTSNVFLLFFLTSFMIIGNEVAMGTRVDTEAAKRDVFLEKMATTTPTTVKWWLSVAADYHLEGKWPWCNWCCNPVVGKLCCMNCNVCPKEGCRAMSGRSDDIDFDFLLLRYN
ncbi:unnamed protein product [Linum trigynum]|uniref:Uncharacterized protein n=1 Tax=Linum trigynum TaxID=586398 RepID=A0AAV2EFM9_9ROSI